MAIDILPDLRDVAGMTAGQAHALAKNNEALYGTLIDRLSPAAKGQARNLLNGLLCGPASLNAGSLSLSAWFHVDGSGRLRYGGPPGPKGDQAHDEVVCETLSGPASLRPFQWAVNVHHRACLAALVWLLTRRQPA